MLWPNGGEVEHQRTVRAQRKPPASRLSSWWMLGNAGRQMRGWGQVFKSCGQKLDLEKEKGRC